MGDKGNILTPYKSKGVQEWDIFIFCYFVCLSPFSHPFILSLPFSFRSTHRFCLSLSFLSNPILSPFSFLPILLIPSPSLSLSFSTHPFLFLPSTKASTCNKMFRATCFSGSISAKISFEMSGGQRSSGHCTLAWPTLRT